jgi:hypothetical protein
MVTASRAKAGMAKVDATVPAVLLDATIQHRGAEPEISPPRIVAVVFLSAKVASPWGRPSPKGYWL